MPYEPNVLKCMTFQWHEHVTSDSGQVISTNALVKHVTRANRYNISRQVAGHYDLVIRHAAFDDAGRYTCAVIDSGELRSAYVVVLGKVRCLSVYFTLRVRSLSMYIRPYV